MDNKRVKTILIGLLLAVNAILGGTLAAETAAEHAAARRAREDMLSLLSEQGVTVRSMPEYSFSAAQCDAERVRESEYAFAEALLGVPEHEEPWGGGVLYTSSLGSLRLRPSGQLDAELNSEMPSFEAGSSLLAALSLFEYICDRDGETVRLKQCHSGRALFNAELEFRENLNVSGRWVFGLTAGDAVEQSYDAVSVLPAFASYMKDSGHSEFVIEGMEAGYMAKAISPDVTRLTPVWKAETDKGIYYVNAMTGVVTTSGE